MSDAESPTGDDSGSPFKREFQDVPRMSDILCDPALESQQVEVEAGTVFYEPEKAADNLYFIRSGQVRVFQPGRDSSERLVEILGPGDWFGVPALGAGPAATYGSRAAAVSRVGVCRVPAERLLA